MRMILALLVAVSLSCLRLEDDYSNDASAVISTRKIVTSQTTYSAGEGNYAVDLKALGDAALIDTLLASGTKDRWAFNTSGDTSTFTVNARPLNYGSGTRSFFSDESGIIRHTREDRPATVEDPPLGQ